MLRPVLVALLASSFLFASNVSHADCRKIVNAEIQHLINTDRIAYQIPGVQVSFLCARERKPRDFVSGTTIIDRMQVVQADHLFQIGSETKLFIAVIILQLESEGLLSIEDPIGKWLLNIPKKWKTITLKQLLNHTSGIYNYTDVFRSRLTSGNPIDLKRQWYGQELIELAAEQVEYFYPGAGWHYSNTNYILAGMIIESVTGNSINAAMQNRIIQPFGLTNTSYIPSIYKENIFQKMAHGYAKSGILKNEPLDITDTNNSWAGAAGANVSTSHDIAIWFNKILKGNILPSKQLNELTTLADMQNGQPIPVTTDSAGYGLGIMHDFQTFDEESWWHSGGTLGYSAYMIWLKSSDIIISVNVNDITSNEHTRRDIYFLTKDLVSYLQNRCDSSPLSPR